MAKWCPFSSVINTTTSSATKYSSSGNLYYENQERTVIANRDSSGYPISGSNCIEDRCAVYLKFANSVGFCGLIGANGAAIMKGDVK